MSPGKGDKRGKAKKPRPGQGEPETMPQTAADAEVAEVEAAEVEAEVVETEGAEVEASEAKAPEAAEALEADPSPEQIPSDEPLAVAGSPTIIDAPNGTALSQSLPGTYTAVPAEPDPPSYAPIFTGLGISVTAWGFLTSPAILALGLLIFACGMLIWIKELTTHES